MEVSEMDRPWEAAGQGTVDWADWQAEHRNAVAAITSAGGVDALNRLGSTLGRASIELVQHLRAASPGPEHDLLDQLVSVVGSALAEVRIGRFRLLAQADAAGGAATGLEAAGMDRPHVEEAIAESGSPMVEHAGAGGRILTDAEMEKAHCGQWEAVELCFRWLAEWEDAEVWTDADLNRLRSQLRVMAAEIEAAATELERMAGPAVAV